jgi:hypothetical protein
MTMMTELDWIVDDYLRQLETALRSLPASRRAQIVAEISEHISQAKTGLPTQDEASIHALLERVGTPREIAASAITEGVPIAPHRGPKRRTELLAIGAAVLLIVIGVVVYLAQSGSSTITMPNVIGKSADAAKSTLESSGIKHISFTVEPSLAPPDSVFSTNTRVGAVVGPNTPIYFQISSGPSVMPNLAGLTGSEATRQLGALGLRWAIVRVHHDQSGHVVVGQTPAFGSKLEKQTWVEVDVTSSSAAVPRLMPRVAFMPAQFAIAELHSLGFKLHVRYFTQVAPPGGWVLGGTTAGSPVTSAGVYIAVAEPPLTHGKDRRPTSS